MIATIFGTNPEGVDALLQSFLLDADKYIKARAFPSIRKWSEEVKRDEWDAP